MRTCWITCHHFPSHTAESRPVSAASPGEVLPAYLASSSCWCEAMVNEHLMILLLEDICCHTSGYTRQMAHFL